MALRSSHGLSCFLGWMLIALAGLAAPPTPAWAEAVQIRAVNHKGFGRLLFFWPSPVAYETAGNDERLIIRFQKPIIADFDPAHEVLGQYLRVVEAAPDGRSVVIPLRDGVTARSFAIDNAVVVDLSKRPQTGAGAALETAAAPAANTAKKPVVVRVRTGEHPGFSRLVFDWRQRVDYQVGRTGDTTSITFDHPARVDLRRLQRKPLKYVTSGTSETNDGTVTVTLAVPEASKARHFRIGSKVVVDVVGSDAAAASTPVPPNAQVVEPETDGPAAEPETDGPAAEPETDGPAAEPETDGPPAEPETDGLAAEPANETADKSAEPADHKAAPVETTPAETAPAESAPTELTSGEIIPDENNAPPAATATPPAESAQPAHVQAPTPDRMEPTQAGSLRFDWNKPVGAAVFRRAGSLWVVFESRLDQEMILPDSSKIVLEDMQEVAVDRATALRMTTSKGINPRMERDGLSWILRFAEQPLAARHSIESTIETDDSGRMRLFLPVPEPGDPIAVTDPEVGDNLIVVPVVPLGHGMSRSYTYPQLRLLVTAQGVVIQPLIDTLRVRSLPDGIEITADGKLSVSPVPKEIRAGARVGSPRGLTRLLALEQWIDDDTVPFDTRRRALERAVVDATPANREQARMDLARFFLAHTFAAEAFGALTLTAQHRPAIVDQPEFRAMRGVSELLLGRMNEARDDLFHERLDGNHEAALWRAAVDATEGQFSQAASTFKDSVAITRTYPKPLRTPLNLLLAEAAIAADQADQAADLMEVLRAEAATPSEQSALAYLEGRYLEAIGDHAGALETWSRVIEGPDRRSRAKAAMAKAELLLETGAITRQQAIEALESLRFAWRGDVQEVRLLRRLARLYQDDENYLSGLTTLRQVAAHFSAGRQAPEITAQMRETFERLFLEGHADALPAISAIALYREFQELTPPGDKGNEMIRKLADRLVEVDLLDDAAALLEKQVRYRLAGLEKAKVGTRLAVVHGLNRNPQAAMDALRASASATDPLPKELIRQRDHIAAEALTALGKPTQALAVLGDDDSLEADLIRSNVYWTTQDWTEASQALRRVVRKAGAEAGKPLSERQSQLVLNLAVALTLSGDEDGVSQVRRQYGDGVSATSVRDAFHLITGTQSNGGVAERDWSTQVKQVASFQAYLAVYRAQLEHEALSAIN